MTVLSFLYSLKKKEYFCCQISTNMENEYVAKTLQGLEGVLEQELKNLGALHTKKLSRAVAFKGDLKLLYSANLNLRTALRILHPIGTHTVKNQQDLYTAAFDNIDWSEWFDVKQTISINAMAFNAPEFNNSGFIALKVKDAIADQFRKKVGSRPSVDKVNPDIIIDVIIYKDQCTFSIDSSGESLHRRGYRDAGHRAPLNEVLAAGMVLLSGWDLETPLVDPFCGTGTILVEAAMYAHNIAPHIQRKRFGFESWKNFDKKIWDKVWMDARANERKFDGVLIGSDISAPVIEHARQHVATAKVDECIRLSVKQFKDRTVPEGPGTVLTNPPYGERLTYAEIEPLYKSMGDKFKSDYTGYNAWVISAVKNFNRFIGLSPSKKMILFNGGLECQFMKFEMYKGSK